ncbi:ATP-binding cassette domain-containing protein [Nocardioides sp. B-3]|nr:ATP-binding cassette domain-containing protein [Nocardioides sp. B-3]UUZ58879.1 ATP-binding cassette domain-containing protein [Nocardioides sp. B-3]
MLGEVGLASDARRRVGGFSLGMRQRLGIAAAMLGDPGVLVPDEPTNRLDPPGVRWLRGYVRRLADEGRTVLLSSHALSEVELTADHVLVMAHGRLLRSSTLAELRAEAGVGSRVRTPDPDRLCVALDAADVGHRRTDDGLAVDAAPRAGGRARRPARDRAAQPRGDSRLGAGLLPADPGIRPDGRASAPAREGRAMTALLRAELLKLRSARITAGLLLATLGLVALTVGASVPKVGGAEAPLSLDDPGLLADVVATCFGVPQLVMVLFGTIAFTQGGSATAPSPRPTSASRGAPGSRSRSGLRWRSPASPSPSPPSHWPCRSPLR